MSDPESELLTLPEAARLLRVRVSTLRAWRAQHRLPFCKVGGRVLLRRADVDQFIADGVIPAKKQVA